MSGYKFNAFTGNLDVVLDKASEIKNTPAGTIAATDVQAALNELDTEKQATSAKNNANGYAGLDSNTLISISQIPPAAIERIVVVADQAARYALTTATVQNGDSVSQTDTTVMYMVKDDTNLNNSAGYLQYSAGIAVNISAITGAGSVPFSNGTNLVEDNTNLRFDNTNDYLTVKNRVQIGSVDAFSRSQIWNALTNASLRLGALGQDGDFADVNSEGIVAYGANSQGTAINSATGDFGYARIKADRIGLLTSIANVQNYYFRVDPTSLYVRNDAGTKTFEVTRSTGNINTSLTASRALATDASKNLVASATTDTELGYVSGVTSAIQTQLDQRHNPSKITVLSAQAGTIATFTTLQTAFNSIPAATNATEARQVYTVYVPSGVYDEDVTVAANNRRIIMVCQGAVSLGTLTGSSWGTGGTARNFTIANNGTATIDGVRSSFAITSTASTSDGLSTHQANISKFKISGNLVLSSAIGISSEFYLEVEVFGNLDASGYAGNCNIYTKNSHYRGTVGSSTARLQYAHRTQFDGLITVNNYTLIDDCVIAAGMATTSATIDLNPSGIVNTHFTGTFTGPASSLRLDGVTNGFFVANGASLAGGATKVYMDAVASATESGIINTSAQTIAGQKTLNSAPILNSLTASTVPYLDASKVLASSSVTPTELGYVSGVTSAIQTQLGGKEPTITVLAESKGGTNQSTYATGDVLYASAANTLSKLGIGSSGKILTVVAGAPSWQPAPASSPTVTAVSSNISLAANTIYLVDTSVARSLTLPTPASGTTMWIKDKTGSGDVNNITLVRAASEKIETVGASFVLDLKLGAWQIVSDGTDWFIL
jgi:hypothetical protein